MSGKNNLLWVAGLGVLGFIGYNALQGVKKNIVVRFHNIGLDVKKGNLFWLQFSIFSPVSFNTTLSNLTGDVYLNWQLVGKVISYQRSQLIARQDTIIEVSFVPNLLGLTALPSIILQKSFRIKCVLNIGIDGVNMPYTIEETADFNTKKS
jgi:hypothetical protein